MVEDMLGDCQRRFCFRDLEARRGDALITDRGNQKEWHVTLSFRAAWPCRTGGSVPWQAGVLVRPVRLHGVTVMDPSDELTHQVSSPATTGRPQNGYDCT